MDRRVDERALRSDIGFLDGDRDGVRQFVAHTLERCFANQLGDARVESVVGGDVVGVELRPFRQVADQDVGEQVDLLAGHGRHRHDVGEVGQLRHRQQLLGDLTLGGDIGLGHDRDQRRAQARQLVGDVAIARPDPLIGRHAESDDVDIGERGANDVVEPLAEQRARPVQPGCVDKHNLRVDTIDDAPHGVPGGLRFVAGDHDLAADEGVGQGRLAGVGTADEAGKTRPMHSFTIRAGPNVNSGARITMPRSHRGEDIVRVALRVVAVLTALTVLSACTFRSGGKSSAAPSTAVQTQIVTTTPSQSPIRIVPPIKTGPTTAATASTCPLLDEASATKRGGMRLGKITVLRSGGRVVGCRFYGLQHPNASCDASCLQKERLPGPNQPAIEIETYRYPSAKDAHNGFVRMSEQQGTNLQQDKIVGQAVGLCFQTHFYANDNGTDWACAFSKGTTVAVVRTVVTSPALTAILVARAVASRV